MLENIESTAVLKSNFENELIEYPKHSKKGIQNCVQKDKSSIEFPASDLTFLKKDKVTVSNVIYFNIKEIIKQFQNLDSWATVEKVTKSTTHFTDTHKKQQQNIRKHANINKAKKDNKKNQDNFLVLLSPYASLATPDEMEMSNISKIYDVSVFFSWITFNIYLY